MRKEDISKGGRSTLRNSIDLPTWHLLVGHITPAVVRVMSPQLPQPLTARSLVVTLQSRDMVCDKKIDGHGQWGAAANSFSPPFLMRDHCGYICGVIMKVRRISLSVSCPIAASLPPWSMGAILGYIDPIGVEDPWEEAFNRHNTYFSDTASPSHLLIYFLFTAPTAEYAPA